MTNAKPSYQEARDEFNAAKEDEQKRLQLLHATAPIMNFVAQVKAQVIMAVHLRYIEWVDTRKKQLNDHPEYYLPETFNNRTACFNGTTGLLGVRDEQDIVPTGATSSRGNTYADLLGRVADELDGKPDIYGLSLRVIIRDKGEPDTACIAIDA